MEALQARSVPVHGFMAQVVGQRRGAAVQDGSQFWRTCEDPCACQASWRYRDGKGCAKAPGKDKEWCYVQGRGAECSPGPGERQVSWSPRVGSGALGPMEYRRWKYCDPDPCQCQATWRYTPTNQTYTNCALPYDPDSANFKAGQPWCYVVGGSNCSTAVASSLQHESRLWRKCETRAARKPDPCSCQRKWFYKGAHYEGCSLPPGSHHRKWCYAEDGYKCPKAMASQFNDEERKWLHCPTTELPGLTCVAPAVSASGVTPPGTYNLKVP